MKIKTKRHKHYLDRSEFDRIYKLINSDDFESNILGFQILYNTSTVNHYRTSLVCVYDLNSLITLEQAILTIMSDMNSTHTSWKRYNKTQTLQYSIYRFIQRRIY